MRPLKRTSRFVKQRWCNVNSGHGQMMDVETSYSEFISCDRTGRRNAVPDIKDEAASVGAGELTKDMSEMSLKPPEGEGPSETPPPEADGPRSEEAQAAENTS
ncbi:cAMP-dependent protein kinase inhibitor gamma isoform X2 [Scleropages formosus]|uniref:cAMP-dependent protein kinase inhibitor gamma isoform X2 n=1 Tax=Scleropages formosus TaxID=113540 RepID=UPI0008781EA2|nr:cAMP-dependent protein kinase inhibitor gamma isoform X2 [Scleropages formosus]